MPSTAEEKKFLSAIEDDDVETVQSMLNKDNKLISKYDIPMRGLPIYSKSGDMVDLLIESNPQLLNKTVSDFKNGKEVKLDFIHWEARYGFGRSLSRITEKYQRLAKDGFLDANMRVMGEPQSSPVPF